MVGSRCPTAACSSAITIVRYRPSGTSAWTELDDTTDSTDTSATLTGLTNDVVYEVQARAENQLGAGAWSDSGPGRARSRLAL